MAWRIDREPRAAERQGLGWQEVALAAVVSVAALATAVIAEQVVRRQARARWWQIALPALVVLAVAGLVVWLVMPDGLASSERSVWLWRHLQMNPAVWLPLGVLIAAVRLALWEHSAANSEWHPATIRLKRLEARRHDAAVRRQIEDGTAGRLPTTTAGGDLALGAWTGGDLVAWRADVGRGRAWVVVPSRLRGLAVVVLGTPGSGKTVTLVRLVAIAAQQGRRVVFLDCKGTDPQLVARIVAAYLLAMPDARIGVFPGMPLDLWRGDGPAIAERLLALVDLSESPFHAAEVQLAVRLACKAKIGPPRGWREFLNRLDSEELAKLYPEGEADPVLEVVRATRMRYEAFAQVVGEQFTDHEGGWSWEDADLAVVQVPTIGRKGEADATARMLLADLQHFGTLRKPRGEEVLVVLDEFSGVSGAVDLATDMAERMRDVGCQLVLSAQSVEGLGDDRQAGRLLATAAGGIVLHRVPDPDLPLKLLGTERYAERSTQLDAQGATGLGSLRSAWRMKVEPDAVRAAEVGEAWAIHAGRYARTRVLETVENPVTSDNALTAAVEVVGAWRDHQQPVRALVALDTGQVQLRGLPTGHVATPIEPWALDSEPPDTTGEPDEEDDVDIRMPRRLWNALCYAVYEGEMDRARELIAHWADVQAAPGVDWDLELAEVIARKEAGDLQGWWRDKPNRGPGVDR